MLTRTPSWLVEVRRPDTRPMGVRVTEAEFNGERPLSDPPDCPKCGSSDQVRVAAGVNVTAIGDPEPVYLALLECGWCIGDVDLSR